MDIRSITQPNESLKPFESRMETMHDQKRHGENEPFSLSARPLHTSRSPSERLQSSSAGAERTSPQADPTRPGTPPLISNAARISPPASSSSASTPPPTTTFCPVNAVPKRKHKAKQSNPAVTERPLAPLAPAPPRPQLPPELRQIAPQPKRSESAGKTLYDIPAEIRVEIYKLVLEDVTLHILPRSAKLEQRAPHALTRTSRIVRNEVLPIIHATCAIEAMITDFNFSGLLEFMARIPPQDQKALTKNNRLKIQLCTTGEKSKGAPQAVSDPESLRRWLAYRADRCKPQPRWEYCGIWPGRKVESDIRRRIKRMTEDGKKRELIELGTKIGMSRLEEVGRP